MRFPFHIADPLQVDRLMLQIKYNDGFVAYLGGQEIARRNAPDPLEWNSTALGVRSVKQSLQTELFELNDFRDRLTVGSNVLTIHGLNAHADSEDFLIVPTLVATELDNDLLATSLVDAVFQQADEPWV